MPKVETATIGGGWPYLKTVLVTCIPWVSRASLEGWVMPKVETATLGRAAVPKVHIGELHVMGLKN